MKKINNRGFVLAETLVVSVFIMTIFTIIYINFYPLIGEYEKREFYDDIDSKYQLYWYKRMIQNNKIVPPAKWTTIDNSIKTQGYYKMDKNNTPDAAYKYIWEQYDKDTNVKELYITGFHLDETTAAGAEDIMPLDKHFKRVTGGSLTLDEDLYDYIMYLPDYKYDSLNGAKYRIIAEFERTYDDTNTYKSFATIEVKR